MATLKRPSPDASREPAARRRPQPPLTPAMTYWLLVGAWPEGRVHGWVAAAQAGLYGEPSADEVWQAHGDALIAEAAAVGFEAFWVHKRRPTGPGFETWKTAFLRAHTY